MLITLDDTRVTYNGNNFVTIFNSLREQGETMDFGLIAVTVESEQPITFAASHSISTARAMYKEQDIITSQSGESITFNLTLCPVLDPLGSRLPQAWTNEMWTLLYTILDTRDYKPLIFGNMTPYSFAESASDPAYVANASDYVSRPYYNCIPLVGSASDLKMFENSQGYVTVPFVCDAPHMWIDVQKTYSRRQGTSALPWYFPSYCNIKDYYGLPAIYPIITISDFQLSNQSGQVEHTYITFQDKQVIDEDNEGWFCLYDVPVDEGTTLYIDNYNKSIYGFNDYTAVVIDPNEHPNPHTEGWYEKSGASYELTTDTSVVENKTYYEQVPHQIDDNYFKYFKNGIIRFLSFTETNQGQLILRPCNDLVGGEQIYHKTLISHYATSYYTIKFFYSCPYMGGNIEADPAAPGNGSVMLHTNEEGS